VIFLGL